ncbi:MAG: 16S rRNA (cytosine1407-C5)-methyltransferase [Candidatus Peregrinibacteria bacterium Gr01-1014_25]|nr:MAG: 16S rRNA (cytosine1407-C5)-methyltransferase [Candidatus Peregrinibacteria bacterium Gr01-1014_25]
MKAIVKWRPRHRSGRCPAILRGVQRRAPNVPGLQIFDRYAAFVDIDALKEFSTRPLRKSVRVNTLKCSVEAFRAHAEAEGWRLEPVPWCREGFFVDRENRERALGRDLLHLLGHFYMQEAASMLPPALLDPQADEPVLDMSAAPGSKTTQMAARMVGRGVVVASDVQENRIWTLITGLYRSGVTNAVVVKKVGQWYGKHMTERFDRVLVDAPCTAQGTARKDSDALRYCGLENVAKMARLQAELLEAGIHAAKVGGRIVYSTCTLTPEENEGVVVSMLNKFCDQLEVVDPDIALREEASAWNAGRAIEDSHRVQTSLCPNPKSLFPFLRLWPQTFDTEGFFCAVLRKTAPTRASLPMEPIDRQEEGVPPSRQREISKVLEERYGTSFLDEGDVLIERGEQILVTTEDAWNFMLPTRDFAAGLPFAKRLADGRMRISHEIVTLRGNRATRGVVDLADDRLADLLGGKDIGCDADAYGDVILRHGGLAIGRGLAKNGALKNNLPREVIQRS